MNTACKHPKVRVVAREEDTEFVECQECGEVFDSDEFRDMEIEEAPDQDEGEDAETAPSRRQNHRAKT
jgi:hypothetical protein